MISFTNRTVTLFIEHEVTSLGCTVGALGSIQRVRQAILVLFARAGNDNGTQNYISKAVI